MHSRLASWASHEAPHGTKIRLGRSIYNPITGSRFFLSFGVGGLAGQTRNLYTLGLNSGRVGMKEDVVHRQESSPNYLFALIEASRDRPVKLLQGTGLSQ